jgi:hypothetical protein
MSLPYLYWEDNQTLAIFYCFPWLRFAWHKAQGGEALKNIGKTYVLLDGTLMFSLIKKCRKASGTSPKGPKKLQFFQGKIIGQYILKEVEDNNFEYFLFESIGLTVLN